jgi:hypothetical protein
MIRNCAPSSVLVAALSHSHSRFNGSEIYTLSIGISIMINNDDHNHHSDIGRKPDNEEKTHEQER